MGLALILGDLQGGVHRRHNQISNCGLQSSTTGIYSHKWISLENLAFPILEPSKNRAIDDFTLIAELQNHACRNRSPQQITHEQGQQTLCLNYGDFNPVFEGLEYALVRILQRRFCHL